MRNVVASMEKDVDQLNAADKKTSACSVAPINGDGEVTLLVGCYAMVLPTR